MHENETNGSGLRAFENESSFSRKAIMVLMIWFLKSCINTILILDRYAPDLLLVLKFLKSLKGDQTSTYEQWTL